MRNFKQCLNYFKVYFGIVFTLICFFSIIGYIFIKGAKSLTPEFLFSLNASEGASLVPMFATTIIVVILTLLISVPIGIGSAIYLNEYARPNSIYVKIIRIAIETLSGIPSIIYGLFGFLFFVLKLGWDWSIISGVFTLSIMILPIIISSSEEALKTVPEGYREGSFALGAGKFETIIRVVLPSAISGILASVILSVGRIVGEVAALTLTAGTLVGFPSSLFESSSTLAVYMYTIVLQGMEMEKAYATGIVLMLVVLLLNIIANCIASKLKRD